MLAFVSQTERENIRKRQAECIRLAKERGVRFGPESKPMPDNFIEIFNNWQSKEISMTKAAELCGCARSTFKHNANLYTKGKMRAKIGY